MKLIGKVSSVSLTMSGNLLLTFECEGRPDIGITDEKMSIEIKKYKEKRSLDANAYAWVLIGKIAEKTRQKKETVYRDYIRDIGSFTTVCVQDKAVDDLRVLWENKGLGWLTETDKSKIAGCTNVLLYYGSSSYDTAQMSRFIDLIVEDAKALGIQTETPDQLALLKTEWK